MHGPPVARHIPEDCSEGPTQPTWMVQGHLTRTAVQTAHCATVSATALWTYWHSSCTVTAFW